MKGSVPSIDNVLMCLPREHLRAGVMRGGDRGSEGRLRSDRAIPKNDSKTCSKSKAVFTACAKLYSKSLLLPHPGTIAFLSFGYLGKVFRYQTCVCCAVSHKLPTTAHSIGASL